MRVLSIVVLLFVALFAWMVPALEASAADCEFVLGFKVLHDLIPDRVGECKTNEYHNPDNGDGLQETTGGLLVWRKADNWTAFTDGYRTWINGPQGLQMRLNTERFAWEQPADDPQQMLLTLADLPAGFAQSDQMASAMADLGSVEGAKSAGVAFTRSDLTQLHGHFAVANMVWIMDRAPAPSEMDAAMAMATQSLNVDPVDAPTVGDWTKVYSMKQTYEEGGFSLSMTCHLFYFTKGKALAYIGACGFGDSASVDDTARLARIVESRIP